MNSPKSVSKIIKQLFYLTKNNLIASGLSYFLTIKIANVLGPYKFGMYSYVLLMSSVFTVLVMFATDQTGPMLYSKIRNKIKVSNIIFSIRVFFFGITLLLCFPLVFMEGWTVTFGIFAFVISALNLSFYYELGGKNVAYSYIFLGERLFYLVMAYGLLFLELLSLKLIFLAVLVSKLGSLFWQFKKNIKVVKHFSILGASQFFHYLQKHLWLVLISYASFMYGGFSRLILEKKFGMEALGIYSAGWQIIMLVTLFQAQVTWIWRLDISKSLVNKSVHEFKHHLRRYVVLTTLPVLGLSIFVYNFSEFIVHFLFGDAYVILIKLLPIFAVYFMVVNLDTLAQILWVSIDRPKEFLSISLSVTIALLLALFYLPDSATLIHLAMLIVGAHGLSVVLLLLVFYFRHFYHIKASYLSHLRKEADHLVEDSGPMILP